MCDLCGRSLPDVESTDGKRFCSAGCRAVHTELDAPDDTEPTTSESTVEDDLARTFLRVDGVHSPTCETYLESVATGQDGVASAEASYVTETVRVDHDPDRITGTDLRDALSTTGYTAYLRAAADEDDSAGTTRREREMSGTRKRRTEDILGMRYAVGMVFGAFLMLPYVVLMYPAHLASLLDRLGIDLLPATLVQPGGSGFLRFYLIMAGFVLLVTGMPVLREAYVSLKTRRPNTGLLVALTAVGAYLYSTVAAFLGRSDVFYDLTLLVAASVTAAVFYESAVKRRAMGRLTDLTVSGVSEARLYEADGTTRTVPVEDLAADDRVLVRQGERVPVDGTLAEGECTVDESVVTGESLPVTKRTGEAVIGGSVVVDGAAVVRADAGQGSIDRLTTAVWNRQSGTHGIQRRVDRLAGVAVPAVVGLAALAGLGAVALGAGPANATLATLLVTLVACPWALGLATPLSVAASVRTALDRGVVVFDETVFERLRSVDVVVFDKTGTLTTGEMEVVEADAPPDLLSAAVALERRAAHPAAEAVVAEFGDDARTDGGVVDEGVSDFRTHATGVGGTVDGAEVLVGSPELFADRGWTVGDDVETRTIEARNRGRLPVVVGREGRAEGVVVLRDEPRSGWEETVTRLDERGMDVVVLTGDDEAAGEFLTRHPGVDRVFSGAPPAGKAAAIRRLGAGARVAMVGDGTNDAPALAEADLGVSIGSGTALAADAADVAIVEDTLSAVETAFDVAAAAGRRVRRTNRLALAYNAVAVPAALVGLFNPLVAAAAFLLTAGLIGAACFR